MNENNRPDDNVAGALSEDEKQNIVWRVYFSQMRFWICCNLLEVLFLFAAPFLFAFFDIHTHYLYHYEPPQIFLLLILLVISSASAFFLFSAKDKSRLKAVKWLSLVDAVMMYLSYVFFRKGIGHATTPEAKLYWVFFIWSVLHVITCIRVFYAYKKI